MCKLSGPCESEEKKFFLSDSDHFNKPQIIGQFNLIIPVTPRADMLLWQDLIHRFKSWNLVLSVKQPPRKCRSKFIVVISVFNLLTE